MNQFQNPFINNNNYFGNQDVNDVNNLGNMNKGCGCNKTPNCPTTYKDCPPIVTCSKQVLNQYHVVRQPYIHNYHTEVVHHHVVQNEFIPKYTCSEVHVNDPNNSYYPN